jgi:hypothetical protein
MSDQEVNVPLLRKVVEWVEAEDKLDPRRREWDQENVIVPEDVRVRDFGHEPGCGTAYCAAGAVAAMVDERFVNARYNRWGYVQLDSGEWISAIGTASRALGIEGVEHSLFRAYNTASNIRAEAERLAGERL